MRVAQWAPMGIIRSVQELADVEEPAWPQIVEWAQDGGRTQILEREPNRAAQTLFRLQVTTRSPTGALAYACGGLVVDHGWLRILGGGTSELVDLATANDLSDPTAHQGPPAHLVVAHDVLGGIFAVNGGGLTGELGEICYWGPDLLEWTPLGIAGHGDLVAWALTGGTDDFYTDLRWPDWQHETSRLGLDQGLSLYPPPSTEQGRDIAAASKMAVPFTELVGFHQELAATLGDHDGPIAFRVTD